MWQHITGEGTALVKEAEDAATNQVEYFFFFLGKAATCLIFLSSKLCYDIMHKLLLCT